MRELFRAEKIKYDRWLEGYDLTIYEGDILYVQCLSDRQLDCLEGIVLGGIKPDSGRIYVDETYVENYNSNMAGKLGIQAAALEPAYRKSDTVLETLTYMEAPYRLYSRRRIMERLKQEFEKEDIRFRPDTPVWKLDGVEWNKLGILKAKLMGARLIVLNINKEVVEGRLAEELCRMIRHMNQEEITFLILSNNYSMLVELATRVQLMHLGMAMKEWTREIPEAVLEKLKYGRFFVSGGREVTEREFVGLYDYDWDLRRSFWEYLACVKENSPQLWERFFGVPLPEDGVGCIGNTAVIPRNSQNLLLEKLSIGENLTLAIADRINYDHSPIINRRLQRKIEEGYYQEQKLPAGETDIRNLTHLQRKILSIARLALRRPAVMFLELPYYDVELAEVEGLRSYLRTLSARGIKIVYFSKSLEHMMLDCSVILRTQEGMRAKIDTL